MKLFGLPLLGFWLPYIGSVKIAVNRDGSFVDTGELDMRDEVGPYYFKPYTFEWFGFGMPITKSYVYDSNTNLVVDAPWQQEAKI